MPLYDFACDSCTVTWEVYQSIKTPFDPICPHCNQPTAHTVPCYNRYGVINTEPKTVGALIDKNTSKMGCYEKEMKEHAAQYGRSKYTGPLHKEVEALPHNPKPANKFAEGPKWNQVNTKEKMERYIYEGKL